MQLHDTARALRGVWYFKFYEGDLEFDYDDSGVLVPINPIVQEARYENLITDVGKALILNRLYGLSSVLALSNTGVGTSSTAAATGNTGITSGVWKGYDATPVLNSLTVTSTTTYSTSEANINIQEAALSNGSPATSAGTILNRLAPIGPFNKTSAVSLAITTQITQT